MLYGFSYPILVQRTLFSMGQAQYSDIASKIKFVRPKDHIHNRSGLFNIST